MAKKKSRKKSWGFAPESQTLNKCLQEFDRYIAKQQWLKAENFLQELDQRFPAKKEVLECWLTFAYEQGDWNIYQQKATEYVEKYPDEPDGYLALSSVYLQNGYFLLALEALQTLAEKFPDHAEITEVNKKIDSINTIVPELLQADYDLEGERALEIAKLNERGRFLLESNQYSEAEKIFTDLVNLAPQFPPGLNNLSLIRCITGNVTEAIALAQQVLELAPNNFQALGNLVRYYILMAETELAEKYLNQLKALDNEVLEIWVKKAESLALFGDWSGLVELGKEAESSDISEDLTALFWHCVAVGYANSGQKTKARQLWQKSLKIQPGFEYAQENLENIKLPLSEQNTPWAFSMNEWLSSKVKEDIKQIALDSSETEDDNKSQLIAKKIIKHNPQIINLIPTLLKRGSPLDRQFAIYLATVTKKPELVAALKEFAFGQEGNDQERLEVAQKLNQQGLIPSGNVKMWIKGEETEILLMAMEINDEPTVIHSKKVQKLAESAVTFLKMQEAEFAESILLEALKLEPSAPDLQFNLTNAYLLQDREEEAYTLLGKIHEEHPDYTFATMSLARHYLKNGELDKAEEIIKPLLYKSKFNRQEFCLLCETHIQLAEKQKNREGALSWLNMWKQLGDEDDSNLDYWCDRLENKSSWFKNMFDV